MIVSGINIDDSGFVFDRGKSTRNSYGAPKLDNISCSLSFRISKAMGFVFDRGKVEVTTKIYAKFI
ncbi:hypothetical protein MKW98_011205 [Papaver atlanticum]|uniref:Uncharacterized protein n=1 Tax=Papaver atlanticum TaxID=357466 RepID=A0AAD4S2Q6_9MAGN|nr:hypothetical protein MKW98_011205 [Papaver atlanticum]